jgi:DNA-binding CsgD family transcriptional regulator
MTALSRIASDRRRGLGARTHLHTRPGCVRRSAAGPAGAILGPVAAAGQLLLAEGEAALDRGDWVAARALFADALAREETPDAHYGLARALEWAGEFTRATRSYEQAYAGYRARGELRRPALIAGRELCFLHAAVYGNSAAAGGWLARARSLAAEAGDCPEAGWVELAAAAATGDPGELAAHAAAASGVARRFGDSDLRFCALAYEGAGLVLHGRVAEGMQRVDEAAVAATSGEVRDHLVIGEIYCKMLLSCEAALDVRRAQEWVAVAHTASAASHDLWVSAICRMHYGGILTAAGRWDEAAAELLASLRLYDDGMRALRWGAAARLADVRVRQGRVVETAELLSGDCEFDSCAVLPLARLHLLRGEREVAVTVLRRFLGAAGTGVLQVAVQALLAEVLATSGRPEEAWAGAERLQALADQTGLPHVRGMAEYVTAVVCHAAGREGVLPRLEAALRSFGQAGLPWEAAHTRLALARLLAGSNPEVAAAEVRRALAEFRRLGAGPDADEAACLLRDLGAPPGPGPRTGGPLTTREREVLRLMVEGLSNQQIAARLFLSKRTVEHHVGNILAKLGVASRAEALAHAMRGGGG